MTPPSTAEPWEKVMEAIQMQATATHNLVQQMAMQRDNTANANRVFYDFLKLQPPTFQGSHNPSEAQAWLNEIKKAFEVVPCIEEQKVAFDAHLLKGGAEYWWRSAKTYLQTQGTHMNWEHFEVAFLDKYYPKSSRRQKELEFVHLQQGDMSVAERMEDKPI
uniref:Uncharacterized protein LOC113786998 n=1 Tax=Cicer arietinum TaxID=3827 RepID=A0A3Q7YC39_CICAR|nr:uncharacterized protein LOC113786998 [Cicer arietinum]